VLDAPGGWYDYYGRVLQTDDGSPFERLFGARLGDFQYSRHTTRLWKIGEQAVEGTILDVQPTKAEVVESYTHGKPAVTRHRLGKGEAVILTWEAAKNAYQPGNSFCEQAIVHYSLGDQNLPYECNLPTYRLAAPDADHYFIMNGGEATSAKLDIHEWQYQSAEDPIDRQSVDLSKIAIDAYSAAWVRCVK
jgi:beta-galactosidase